MEYNNWVWFVAAVIPILLGYAWYHPAVFGQSWMKSAGLFESDLHRGRMGVILGLTYFFSLLIARALAGIVIHQDGFFALFAMEYSAGDTEIRTLVDDILNTYGDKHRHFGHGVLHGGIAALFFAVPAMAINALFERRPWKYSLIHAGYWFLCLALMGGLICQFA